MINGYSLDTSTCIDIIRATHPKARQSFAQAVKAGHSIAISSIVLHELAFGVHRSKDQQRSQNALNIFLNGVTVLEFDADDATETGKIRAHLMNRGTGIGPFDVLIASQAVRRNLSIVTGNVKEFSRVGDLIVENWSE